MKEIRKIRALTRRVFGCLAVGVVVFAMGCGSGKPMGEVKGQVFFRGKGVSGAEVHFYSKELGVGTVGKLDELGTFAFADPIQAGTYTVHVTPAAPEPGVRTRGTTRPTKTSIPVKYRDPNTSTLSITVEPGTNDLKIQLQD